jgi:FAD:protein FMN transferase
MARALVWGTENNKKKSWLALGTVVQIELVTTCDMATINEAFGAALKPLRAVEDACSRFDAESELVRLLHTPIGRAVPVSSVLFQSVKFALEVASWTDGRFDPTVGARMEELGFKRHYLTGESVESTFEAAPDATYRDVELDEENQTICLHRPLKLDLGAVAKGLAVDLAVRELNAFDFPGFVIDAGGDLYVSGQSAQTDLWNVGIRNPIQNEENILMLKLTDAAICTSGTYERKSPVDANTHHILNARQNESAKGILSTSAIGPFAMMADALSTAAFLYPPNEAVSMLEEAGLEGLVIADDISCQMTSGMERYLT